MFKLMILEKNIEIFVKKNMVVIIPFRSKNLKINQGKLVWKSMAQNTM
jgi:hypothetical protein